MCKANEKRVFSNTEVLDKVKELNVQFVVVDYTTKDDAIGKDLARADQGVIPVNLIYPPNYPDQPAILLNEIISPAQALTALERIEKSQRSLTSRQPESTRVAATQ